MTDQTVVKAVDSASILIIRDGEDHPDYGSLEVLMVKRHHNIKFAGGAYVFPGGKVDEADRNLEEKSEIPVDSDIPDSFKGLRYAALREVFEETGLLLATLKGECLDEVSRKSLDAHYRHRFWEGQITLEGFLQQSGVEMSLKNCLPFAHWITPEQYPKRFDTRFFLCVAPDGQVASPDGHEIVETLWVKPLDMVLNAKADLMFPTLMNLKKIGRAKSVDDALQRARTDEIVAITPVLVKGKKGFFRLVPEESKLKDLGYDDIDQSIIHPGMDNKNL